MAKGISDLGNGNGIVYITEPDGTSFVKQFDNEADNMPELKLIALQAAAFSANLIAFGTIEFTAISGTGDITDITVAGDSIISATISVTAGTPTSVAALVVTQINAFDNSAAPAGTPNYTASSSGAIVTIYANETTNSSSNGAVIVVSNTDPGNIVSTLTPFAGGADANLIYDENSGFRIFLDADYGSGQCSGDGDAVEGDISNAIEITSEIVFQGYHGTLKSTSKTIATGAISPDRKGNISLLLIDTEAAAGTDDLDTIRAQGFSVNDIIIARPRITGQTVVFKDGTGNLLLAASNDFSATSFQTTSITLQWDGTNWLEIHRSESTVPTVAAFRTALFPDTGFLGNTATTVPTSGTLSITPNVETKYHTLSGTVSLVGNYTVTFETTGSIAGDEIWVENNALVTVGAFNLTIGGVTLTAAQALTGGYVIKGYYNGSSWETTVWRDANNGGKIDTADISANAITVAKLASSLQVDGVWFPVSFEASETGDMKFEMPYAGTVNKISAHVTKAIAATDDATIVPKNAATTAMTAGTITLSASTAIGTTVTSSPTGNNTFVAGDILIFTTAKSTAGGTAMVSVKVTRT